MQNTLMGSQKVQGVGHVPSTHLLLEAAVAQFAAFEPQVLITHQLLARDLDDTYASVVSFI